MVLWLALSPHSKEVLSPGNLWLGQGLSVWSLHVLLVSAWVLFGYSGFLSQSKDMQHNSLIGDSKLPVVVCLYVSALR